MKVYNHFQNLLKKYKNVAWLVALSVTIALSQFAVYFLITKTLGKSSLGIWSLIVAATSIGQISTFGFSSSLIRFLPELISKNQFEKVNRMLGTVNISNFLLSLPLLLILYLPAVWYGRLLLGNDRIAEFQTVLGIYMASMFLNNLFLVYSYTFDAFEKHHIRSKIQMAGWTIFLVASYLLLPALGLRGIAIASVGQNIFQFGTILLLASRLDNLHRVYPFAFHKESFRRIFSFGIHSQTISLLVIFFDPLVKYFITRHTGLVGTANYELANKIVSQFRNLWVSASQVIVPRIVRHNVLGTEDLFFSKIVHLSTIISIFSGLLNILIAPVAVYIFSGHFDYFLFQIIILVNVGITVNMLTIPHYFSAIALDKISKLVIYHLMLSAVTIVFYLIISFKEHDKILYFLAPPIGYLIAGIYNSYILGKTISHRYTWLKSGDFIFFISISILFSLLLTATVQAVFYVFLVAVLIYLYRLYLFVKSPEITNLLTSHE